MDKNKYYTDEGIAYYGDGLAYYAVGSSRHEYRYNMKSFSIEHTVISESVMFIFIDFMIPICVAI